MKEDFYLEPVDPSARKNIEKWLDCEDNEEIRSKIMETVEQGLANRGGVQDRQEAVMYLEHLLRDAGYPEGVSITITPPTEGGSMSGIHVETISPLDGETLKVTFYY